jgi:hypothetical protein
MPQMVDLIRKVIADELLECRSCRRIYEVKYVDGTAQLVSV